VQVPLAQPDSRKGKSCPNGITPPVDGEAFDMKRTYAFRKSTIRKLNELKALIFADGIIFLNSQKNIGFLFYLWQLCKN